MFIKNVPHESGAVATFWRIVGLAYNTVAMMEGAQTPGVAQITMAGYISEQAFKEGKKPLMLRNYVVTGEDLPLMLASEGIAALESTAATIMRKSGEFKKKPVAEPVEEE